jgi:hypothetical protein
MIVIPVRHHCCHRERRHRMQGIKSPGMQRVVRAINAAAFIAAVPASIYAVGLLRKDSYAQKTGLLAVEAVADGFALDLAFKGVTGRKQPSQYFGNGPYNDSFTKSPVKSAKTIAGTKSRRSVRV